MLPLTRARDHARTPLSSWSCSWPLRAA